MTDNQFDDYFRKKLDGFSSEVPVDMWERIKKKKDKERKFFFIPWRYFVALLLLAGIATGYYFLRPVQSQKNNNQIVLNNAEADNTSKQQSADENNNEQHQPGNDSNTKQQMAISEINNADPLESNQADFRGGKPLKHEMYSNDKNSIHENQSNNDAVTGSSVELTISSQGNKTNHKQDPGDPASANSKLSKANYADTANALKNTSTKLSAYDPALYNKDIIAQQETGNTGNEEPLLKGIGIEVYASPDFPVNVIQSDNEALEQQKKLSEKMLLSYTAGIRLKLVLDDRFSAKVGFQYSQINQEFTYSQYMVRTVPVIINRTFSDSMGISGIHSDTSNYMQAGTSTVTYYNRYRSFDLPLLIGYQFGKSRLQTTLTSGIILNLTSKYSGQVLDASLNPVLLNTGTAYKNNMGISLYAGLNMSVQLNKKVQLFTEPYLRYRLGNMTKPSQPFTQRIHVGGLSLGLRYNF